MNSHCKTLEEDEEWMANLHFVRSDIDPATVKPIDSRQLASLVNEFLLRSADILNRFCAQFENRMMELDFRLDTFERMLTLMERKLENINVDEVKKQSAEEKETAEKAEGMTRKEKGEETAEGTGEEKRTEKRQGKETAAEGTTKAKEHPKLAKYFKMLKMGVPEAAVRQKMRSEGMDDAFLNDPEKELPLESPQNKAQIGHDALAEDDESSSNSDE